jgi:hypothetical protein
MHRVEPVLVLVAVMVAAGSLGTVALCWRRHAVLAGLPALGAFVLSGLAIWRDLAGHPGATSVLGALAALLIAVALLTIGGALWRLLDEPSDCQ